MWFDLVEATDEILLAALRSRYKSPDEVAAAYRQIYARQVEEHDKKMLHMMTETWELSPSPPGIMSAIHAMWICWSGFNHWMRLARRVELKLPGMDEPVFMLSCEDLILFKLNAGRILDRSDCAYLLRFNRETLDLPYLTQWAGKLRISTELADIWREAFGEQGPPSV